MAETKQTVGNETVSELFSIFDKAPELRDKMVEVGMELSDVDTLIKMAENAKSIQQIRNIEVETAIEKYNTLDKQYRDSLEMNKEMLRRTSVIDKKEEQKQNEQKATTPQDIFKQFSEKIVT